MERNTNVWLPLVRPLLGTWLGSQTCVLTGNQTCDPLVRSLVLNPLSHTSQGLSGILIFAIPISEKHFSVQYLTLSDAENLFKYFLVIPCLPLLFALNLLFLFAIYIFPQVIVCLLTLYMASFVTVS